MTTNTTTFGELESSKLLAAAYGLDDRGFAVRVPEGSRIFTPLYRRDRLQASLNLLYNGHRQFFSGVRWQVREADLTALTAIKRSRIYRTAPPIHLHYAVLS
jgi:GAF domain-containing protein